MGKTECGQVEDTGLMVWNWVTYFFSPESGKPENTERFRLWLRSQEEGAQEDYALGDIPRIPEELKKKENENA